MKFKDIINESTIDIDVYDIKYNIDGLKKLGVKAVSKKDNKITVDLKDKDKIIEWLLKSRNEKISNLKIGYPELFK